MGAVDIGIGHDDDFVVAHLVEVEILAVAAADGGDQRFDGVGLHHAVEACAFGVEDLASQRQDGLRDRVASLDGGAACGITLHDEQLAFLRIVGLAVLQLVRHAGRFEDRLAAGVLTRLLGGETRAGGFDGLLDDVLGLARVGVEPIAELVGHDALHEGLRLGVAELGLRLAFELRVGELDGHHCGQAFAHVVAGEVLVLVLEDVLLACVAVDQGGQRGAEAFLVGAAFGGGDGVGEGVHGFGVRGGPLHGDFRGDADFEVLGFEIDDVRFHRSGLARLHQVVDVVLDAVVVLVGDGLELVLAVVVLAGHLVAGLIGFAQVGE